MKYEEIREFNKDVQWEIGQRIQEARLAKGIAGVEVAAYLGIGKIKCLVLKLEERTVPFRNYMF